MKTITVGNYPVKTREQRVIEKHQRDCQKSGGNGMLRGKALRDWWAARASPKAVK